MQWFGYPARWLAEYGAVACRSWEEQSISFCRTGTMLLRTTSGLQLWGLSASCTRARPMPSRKQSESLFWSLLLTTVFAHACALRRAFSFCLFMTSRPQPWVLSAHCTRASPKPCRRQTELLPWYDIKLLNTAPNWPSLLAFWCSTWQYGITQQTLIDKDSPLSIPLLWN